MTDLLDVNVWLALVDKRHIHHPAASRYWADATVPSRAFCRVTANGFLRLSTHASVMPNPLSPHEAWIISRQFLVLPIISWLSEPAGLDDQYCALSCAPGFELHAIETIASQGDWGNGNGGLTRNPCSRQLWMPGRGPA